MNKKNVYLGCDEIFPGVYVDFTEEPAVYIADEKGEIVCWVYDEVKEDPSAWTASMRAVAIAAKEGPQAVRELLDG